MINPHIARRRYGLGYLIYIISELHRELAKLVKYRLYLIGFRKKMASHFERFPLIREPLNKSYGDHWLPAQFGIKAGLRRHAVARQEVATPSPNCAGSPGGRVLKHVSAALQPSPRATAVAFALRFASTRFRARRDPIGLVQRFLSYGYASAGDHPNYFTSFSLNSDPFMQYAG